MAIPAGAPITVANDLIESPLIASDNAKSCQQSQVL